MLGNCYLPELFGVRILEFLSNCHLIGYDRVSGMSEARRHSRSPELRPRPPGREAPGSGSGPDGRRQRARRSAAVSQPPVAAAAADDDDEGFEIDDGMGSETRSRSLPRPVRQAAPFRAARTAVVADPAPFRRPRRSRRSCSRRSLLEPARRGRRGRRRAARAAARAARGATRRIVSYLISSHRIVSHRLASHRIASHRTAPYHFATHRTASHSIFVCKQVI